MTDKKINIKLIINGCKQNNRNSQRVLFESYMGFALNICLRYAKNKESAEEILNDGFIKVFNKIKQYDNDYPFKSWLRKIMINSAIDYFRANQNKLTYVELHNEEQISEQQVSMPTLSPNEDLLPILQKLSPVYRMVFNLAIIEGYKHHEIAEIMGISASTSRSNLVRAKRNLRSIILGKRQVSPTFIPSKKGQL